MDNARFHHARITIAKLEELGITYMYLPPYSPQLNPIEEFFSMIKARFNGIRNPANTVEVDLDSVLMSDFRVPCLEFYAYMLRWVEKARQRQDFI